MFVRRTKPVFILLYQGNIYLKHSCNRFGRGKLRSLVQEINMKNLIGRINNEQL